MNRVVLMGRLTRDPEVRYSQGETPMAIARYTLAVDRRRGRNAGGQDENSADFISCVAFGRSGEFAEKYLRKGMRICISGRIQTGSYTNKDGVKVYTTEVVAEDQEFADSKGSAQGADSYGQSSYGGGSSYGNSGSYGNPGGGNRQADPGTSGSIEGFINIPDGIDEELPFT